MILIADSEGFWTVKSLVDWVTILGLPLTLFSIWLSLKLAERDLRGRIAQAQNETLDRLTNNLLNTDVVETARLLSEAREADRVKNRERTIDRCEQAMRRIPKLSPLPGLEDSDRSKLDTAVDDLRVIIQYLETKKTDALSSAKTDQLDKMMVLVSSVEGKLRVKGLRRP